MAGQVFKVDIVGGWVDSDINIPAASGILFVYASEIGEEDISSNLNRLLYITESADINSHIESDCVFKKLKPYLREYEQLYYYVSACGSRFRKRIAAAFIHQHKPIANSEFVNSFPFHETTVEMYNNIPYLEDRFKVVKKVDDLAFSLVD